LNPDSAVQLTQRARSEAATSEARDINGRWSTKSPLFFAVEG
jgi:hypothetical protein